MANTIWARLDGFMRLGHLYTGLFLVPWMAIYATSAFCLNHDRWFPPLFQSWQVVKEVEIAADSLPATAPEEQVHELLEKLGLDGPHRIIGEPTAKEMQIYRMCPSGDYRITWQPARSRAVVRRQQPFSALRMVHSLHFGRGYASRYAAATAWALSVDAVAISTWFWVISGIYLWARRPKQRALGWTCLIAGGAVFALLVAMLCR